MKLDKYSNYLYKYMKKIKYYMIRKINIDNTIIRNLLNISENINRSKVIIPSYQIKYIKKIHDKNEYPLYYELFKNKYNDIKTFKDFIIYYTKNQHNINISDINAKLIKNLNENLNENINENLNEKLINNYNEIINVFYNNFLSIDVIQELESNDLKNITINNDYYKISLYYYDINDINILNELEKIIKIINLIRSINKYYKINNHDFYNIIIFLSNRKKYLFDKTKLISPMNINSGATICLHNVIVWRKEELEKVLIHELLHYIQLDYDLFQNNYLCEEINDLFNFSDKIDKNRINESYNEAVAGIINMCWKSVKYNLNIQQIYDIEMKFLFFQTCKIIKYFNGYSGEDLFNININQTTSFLSYIILKMILFYNINELLDFINKINFRIKETDINDYKCMLKMMINKKDYVTDINNILKITFKTRFLNKTMRMSIL